MDGPWVRGVSTGAHERGTVASYEKTGRVRKRDRATGYRVRWREWCGTDEERQYRQATVYGEAAAQALAAEKSALERRQLAQRADGTVPLATSTPIGRGIGEWLTYYASLDTTGREALERAKGEARTWILPSLREWGVATTGDLTLEHLKRLRDERPILRNGATNGQPASIGTKNRVVSVLQAMSRDMHHLGLIEEDLAAGRHGLGTLGTGGTKKVQVPDLSTLEAAREVLDRRAVNELGDVGGWRPSLCVDLLALAGGRFSEVAGLAPEDLSSSLARPYVRFHRSRLRDGTERCAEAGERGKTAKAWREVTADRLLRETIGELAVFCQEMPCGSCGETTGGRLLCDWRGDPLSYDWLKNRWKTACQVAAVPPISLNSLRHLGISRLIRAGASPFQAMRLAGHSKIETTIQTYADLWPSDHADIAALLDEFGWGRPTPDVGEAHTRPT